MIIENSDPHSHYSAVFEDDGRTAYVYLREGKQIVADVWIYNHEEPPAEPDWTDRKLAPFRNPQGYASNRRIEPVRTPSDATFSWIHSEGTKVMLEFKIRGEVFGRLAPRSKPGWSLLAVRDGPLAKVLKNEGHDAH